MTLSKYIKVQNMYVKFRRTIAAVMLLPALAAGCASTSKNTPEEDARLEEAHAMCEREGGCVMISRKALKTILDAANAKWSGGA